MKTKIIITYCLLLICVIKVYGQDFDLIQLESKKNYTKNEIKFILKQVDKELLKNVEKTETFNDIIHRVLYYEPRKFLKIVKKMKNVDLKTLFQIIEDPLDDKYNFNETIIIIEKMNCSSKLKKDLIESLKKII